MISSEGMQKHKDADCLAQSALFRDATCGETESCRGHRAEPQGTCWGAVGSRRKKQHLHMTPRARPEKWVLRLTLRTEQLHDLVERLPSLMLELEHVSWDSSQRKSCEAGCELHWLPV